MKYVLGLICCAIAGLAQCQMDTELEFDVVAENLYVPWDMAWGLDNNIWVLQKDGQLTRINPDTHEKEDVYKIPDVFQSDDNSGAHGMTLHPQFPLVPWIYCNYTHTEYRANLIRLQISLNGAGGTTAVKTFFDTIPGNSSHNGSRLVFGPDNYLYFSTGDAYMSEWAQYPENIAGKILRMDENGLPAPNNPFGGYVYTIGHRNPQGLVFSDSGILYSTEHGTSNDDEVNIINGGKNYGWPTISGYCDTPSEQANCAENDYTEPLTTWTPTEAPCGIAYFDDASIPEWQNSLLVCFLKGQCLRILKLNDQGDEVVEETTFLHEEFGRIRDVLVAPNGRVFISTSNREINGWDWLATVEDDRIIELKNPEHTYPALESFMENISFNEGIYQLFPNPIQSHLNIAYSHNAEMLQIEVTDMKGQSVLSQRVEPVVEGICQLHLTDLASGAYTVHIRANGVPDFSQTILRQ